METSKNSAYMTAEKFIFDSYRAALTAPAPERDSDKKVVEYWHPAFKGFGLRVGRPRADGVVKRQYLARPNAQAVAAGAPAKPVLGLVVECDGVPALAYSQAMEAALRLVNGARIQAAIGYTFATVGEIYAKTEEFFESQASESKMSPSYIKTIQDTYRRYLSQLSDKIMSDLDETFWLNYIERCRDGEIAPVDGRVYHAPSASSQRKILNTVSFILRIGHKHRMVGDKSRVWNPTRAVYPETGKPNERDESITLPALRMTWRAANQLLQPWWRDLFKIYLLTGLRDKLLSDLKWSQVDLNRECFIFKPTDSGVKRHRKDLSEKERKKLIYIPYSSEVSRILKERFEFNPTDNYEDYVWYPPPSTKRRKTDSNGGSNRLSDPRSAWANLEPYAGFAVKKHDLRRTFASVGAAVLPGMLDDKKNPHLSFLMMHSAPTAATETGLPLMTLRYIKNQTEPMRAAAEVITQAVLEIAGERPISSVTKGLSKLTLPPELRAQLRRENPGPSKLSSDDDDDITDVELVEID